MQTMYIMYVFMTFYLKIADGTNRRGDEAVPFADTCVSMRFYLHRSHVRNAPHWKPGQHSRITVQLLSPRDQVKLVYF